TEQKSGMPSAVSESFSIPLYSLTRSDLEAIKAALVEREWLPIETADSAVATGDSILLTCNGEVFEGYAYREFEDSEPEWYPANEHPTDYTAEQVFPTHWRSLPAPPRAA